MTMLERFVGKVAESTAHSVRSTAQGLFVLAVPSQRKLFALYIICKIAITPLMLVPAAILQVI